VSRRAPAAARPLYLDCFSGAAGNMILGALLEVGVPASVVRSELAKLGIEGLSLRVSGVKRGALHASYVSFKGPERDAKERRFAAIRTLLRRSSLAPRVRERSLAVFTRLAEAEARIHGTRPEAVHFHEVGAVDAIGDIVGVCVALEHLKVDRVIASPLPLGRGTVQTEHGTLPLPAPATVELLAGVPTYPADVEWETVTPTGAALLATLADSFGTLPAMTLEAQGFGAGNDRVGPLPNVLRAYLGRGAATLETDRVAVLETHLDDMNPEQLPFLLEELMRDGALDASLTPLLMKKGRLGQLLRVIARPVDRERLARRILLESSALGVRHSELPRLVLPREVAHVETEYGRIKVKRARAPDGAVTAAPEYEACARAARRHGVPIDRVYRAAQRSADAESGS
jgi:uncharacterized protein (TIGR00299 family) protein